VFERFTERAREVLVFAQDEARSLKHNYIGTEHILLGLLREEEGIGARVLESLDITAEDVRATVAEIIGQGDEVTSGHIPFTPRAKKTLELSLREALSLGHEYTDTEHLLLGLVRENEGVAARILAGCGATPRDIAAKTIEFLDGRGGDVYSTSFPAYVALDEETPRRFADYGGRSARIRLPLMTAVFAGWLIFAIAAGLGVLVGWLIWR
jgi:ATP-dependent Clp protease ATP-binding subunit ClpC